MPTNASDLGRHISRSRGATWVTALATLGLCSVVVWMLVQLRNDEWHTAETTARNTVQLIRQDLDRMIESYDLSLVGAIQGLSLDGIDQVTPKIKQAAVFDNSIRGRSLGDVIVLDSTGKLILQSDNITPQALNNSDRDYFIAHRDRNDVGLHLSNPNISRISGDPAVVLSRRLSNLDGSFAGVVAGNLHLSYLRELLGKVSLTPRSSISVFRRDGTLLMRVPEIEGGRSIAGSATYRNATSSRSGMFVGNAAIDGLERLYAFEHLSAAPVFVNVALSVDDILAAWWTRALQVGLLVLGLSGIMMWLMLRSERSLQRRALAEARLGDALEKVALLSATDALTGLANRRRFDEMIETELLDARRTSNPLSLLMIDADCFKAYNDQHGHQAGDEVLRAIANCLAECTRRPRDVAFRVGGEEFAALLPDTNARGAYEVAAAIQSALAQRAIPHPMGSGTSVTVSIGVTTVKPGGENTAERLYRTADAALYEAKNDGRNCIRSVEVLPLEPHATAGRQPPSSELLTAAFPSCRCAD